MGSRRRSHAVRYRQIIEVLARHGLGFLTGSLGIDRLVSRGGREPRTAAQRLRMALEELGIAAVKLGQVLSTRPDLLPPEYIAELSTLQDAAPPVPWKDIQAVLVAAFDKPVEELFASVDEKPLAAASIGQVHAATLFDGTEVVVKIRRPGSVEQVMQDLEILEDLARSASKHWDVAKQYDVVGLAREFSDTLRAELDYLQEGRNAERIAANFQGNPSVRIPKIYWSTTTSDVLTMERVRGIKITDVAELERAGIDRKDLAQRAADMVLHMVFEHGFFHADPHPGNFFIEPDGRIALIDFGMVGVLTDETRQRLVDLVLAIADQDVERITDVVLDIAVLHQPVDREALESDVRHLVGRYLNRPLGEIDVRSVTDDVLHAVRQHRMQVPADLLLVIKMSVMVEGLGAQLDPDFQLFDVLQPYGRYLLLQRYSPSVWARRIGESSIDAVELGMGLPRQLRRILAEIERGDFTVGARPTGVDRYMRRLEHLINRLVLALLASAFIVGLAMLMTVYQPLEDTKWLGVIFATGFTLAVMIGLYLAWSILRSNRDQ